MIFLNPAILIGLLAASIPIIIHLFNIRKLKTIEFSTLDFLKELQKNKIRKIKIKQWILLALRTMIILLLITGFARPTLEGVAIGGTSSAAKTSSVFIIDDTFSMSVVDGNGSFLNQAKQYAKEILEQMGEGDEAAIVTVSNPGKEIYLLNNLNQIKKEIEELSPSYKHGTLHDALVNAARILSMSNNFNKEIFLFTDFQKNGIEKGGLSDLSELLNDKIRLFLMDFSGKEVYNVSVDDFYSETKIFELNKPVILKSAITNRTKQTVSNAVVSLFLNGERFSQQSVTISAGETSLIDFEVNINQKGFNELFIEIEDDEILHDNKRFLTIYIPEKINILLLTENEKDFRFIELALKLNEESEVFEITKRNVNQINIVDLKRFDAVFLSGLLNDISKINGFVNEGGGLFLFPSSNADVNKTNEFNNKLGIPLVQEFISKQSEQSVVFNAISFEHPIFENIFADKRKRELESPEFYKYYRITSDFRAKSIITLFDNSVFISEVNKGKGKILISSSLPILEWNSFPLKSFFVPFITKSAFYLSAKEGNGINYTVGDKIELRREEFSLPQVNILIPGNRNEVINFQENENSILFENTNETGNYILTENDKIKNIISVNHDKSESIQGYESFNSFEEYLDKISFKGKLYELKRGEEITTQVTQARYGSELWKWFIMLAVIIAAIEMLIARNTKKELASI